MLINLRNAMMAGKRLPYDAEVEYLESSMTQWIDAGMDPSVCNTSTMAVDIDFAVLQPVGDAYTGIFGAVVPRFGAYTINTGLSFGYAQASDNVTTIDYGTRYNLKMSLTKGAQSAELDGVSVWAHNRGGTLTSAYTIGLFCRNSSTAQWINKLRIYKAKFYIADTLVRDFIPVRKGTVGYLYNRVSGKLFGNAGTGDFVIGLDKN